MGVEGQFHVCSNKDEPGLTGKMIKHSTSTRWLKTCGRIVSFTIAINCLALLKKILRKSELLIYFYFYQHVLHTKKERRMSKQQEQLSVNDHTIVHAVPQFKNAAIQVTVSITKLGERALFATR